jgi:hypothetical protein
MCEQSSHIKLCTCGGMNFSKGNSWQLNKAASEIHIVGEWLWFEGLAEFNLPSIIAERLTHDLNSHNVFDFFYQPAKDDLLTLNFDHLTFYFLHNGEKFRSVNEDHLEWKGTHLRSGKVKLQY